MKDKEKKEKKKTSVALGVFNPHLKYKQIICINPWLFNN